MTQTYDRNRSFSLYSGSRQEQAICCNSDVVRNRSCSNDGEEDRNRPFLQARGRQEHTKKVTEKEMLKINVTRLLPEIPTGYR